jgi:hypothetical protein
MEQTTNKNRQKTRNENGKKIRYDMTVIKFFD